MVEIIQTTKDFIEFPKALNKKCSEKKFHEMMTSFNSDIPIERVTFLDYGFLCENVVYIGKAP